MYDGWLLFGLAAQLVFLFRFVIQWLASERAGRSVLPVVFWYFSLAGSAMLFLYASYRRDPIFILGQSLGCFIYIRNLVLIYRRSAGQRPDVLARKLAYSSIFVLTFVLTPLTGLALYRVVAGRTEKSPQATDVSLRQYRVLECRGLALSATGPASLEAWALAGDFYLEILNRSKRPATLQVDFFNIPPANSFTIQGGQKYSETASTGRRTLRFETSPLATLTISGGPREGYSFTIWTIPPGRLDALEKVFGASRASGASFSVGLGNFTPRARRVEFLALLELLRSEPSTTYLIPGERELTGARVSDSFSALFGAKPAAVSYGDSRLLLLDSSKSKLGQEQLAWLRNQLESSAPFAHVFIVSSRSLASSGDSKDPSLLDPAESREVTTLSRKFGVAAILSASPGGYSIQEKDGLIHVAAGSASDFRLVRVEVKKASVTFHPEAVSVPSRPSLIQRSKVLSLVFSSVLRTSLSLWALSALVALGWAFVLFQLSIPLFQKLLGVKSPKTPRPSGPPSDPV